MERLHTSHATHTIHSITIKYLEVYLPEFPNITQRLVRELKGMGDIEISRLLWVWLLY